MSDSDPIVMISSYPPRLCGIATFVEEAREFVQKANPEREVLVISHTDGQGEGGFPTIVEPHTVHGRLTDFEADFVYKMCERAKVVLLKCHYQKWRLDWIFVGEGWRTPRDVMVVPEGARPD